VAFGRKAVAAKLIVNVQSGTISKSSFSDSYHYYRFKDDDADSAVLAASNAGNGPVSADSLGAGGCRWSFCPHTAHNSYVLDVALAEEIERAVAGASVDSRAMAVNKLRQRVREAAAADAPDWNLCNTTALSPDSRTVISVYQVRCFFLLCFCFVLFWFGLVWFGLV
jgi:hypothetical protein